MSRYLYLMVGFFLSLGIVACSERPPVDWMYAEYKSLFFLCPKTGEKVERKSSTASLTYTWSCPYPKNFDDWLSGFEKEHLLPRGWQKGNTQTPYPWLTYCNSHQKVVMRIVKVDAKKAGEDDRLWISIRFPGNECKDTSALKAPT